MLTPLQIKTLKIAAAIAEMNGSRAGNRPCQDWSGDQSVLDNLTQTDKDELMQYYEQFNSEGRDYEPGEFPDDEMVISFCTWQNLLKMIDDHE